ncbi:MAG: hypothetical protein JRI68_34825 [Deltaproteobacteria bacterium]|nr:hypothetical protein [Deltaproteobacteria bacterium]
MKKLGILVALSMTLAATSGCDSTCGTFCEGYVTCSDEDLDEVGCKFDDDLEIVIEECEEECDKAYDKLSSDEADEFDLCIDCVEEEIGAFDECKDGDLADAIHDCDNECEEDGAEEFWEDFELDVDIDC